MLKPKTAYARLNTLIWMGRLPVAIIIFIPDAALPHCYGITLFDNEFALPVIFLNSSYKHWGKTLVHEILHVAEPTLAHGKIFNALVESYWRRARKEIKGLV